MSENLLYFVGGIFLSILISLIFALLGGRLSRFFDNWTEKRALDNRYKTRETMINELIAADSLHNDKWQFFSYVAHYGLSVFATIYTALFGWFILIMCAVAGILISFLLPNPPESWRALILGSSWFPIIRFLVKLVIVLLAGLAFAITYYLLNSAFNLLNIITTMTWRVRLFHFFKAGVIKRIAEIDNVTEEQATKLIEEELKSSTRVSEFPEEEMIKLADGE